MRYFFSMYQKKRKKEKLWVQSTEEEEKTMGAQFDLAILGVHEYGKVIKKSSGIML